MTSAMDRGTTPRTVVAAVDLPGPAAAAIGAGCQIRGEHRYEGESLRFGRLAHRTGVLSGQFRSDAGGARGEIERDAGRWGRLVLAAGTRLLRRKNPK